ncbi:MAG TPA: hypothetical protein VGE76_16965 [Opitutaceae bacterium]
MKLPAWLAISLASLAAVSAPAQTTEPATPEKKKALPRIVIPSDKPATTQPAPATAPKAAAPAPAMQPAVAAPKTPAPKITPKKKEEEMGRIDGVEVARGAKGYFGIQVVNGAFKVTFYNDKKKPAPAGDVDRAALRWNPIHKKGDERVVLLPDGTGQSFTAGTPVRPPYNFKLFVTLIKDATDGQPATTESYTVDFRQ